MPFPKTHCFRGIRYKLRWRKPPLTKQERTAGRKKSATQVLGKTYFPEPKFKAIMYLDPDVESTEVLFNLVLHESLHGCFPDLDECAITDAANDIESLFFKGMKMKISLPK